MGATWRQSPADPWFSHCTCTVCFRMCSGAMSTLVMTKKTGICGRERREGERGGRISKPKVLQHHEGTGKG